MKPLLGLKSEASAQWNNLAIASIYLSTILSLPCPVVLAKYLATHRHYHIKILLALGTISEVENFSLEAQL
jgi:hypothetical protein